MTLHVIINNQDYIFEESKDLKPHEAIMLVREKIKKQFGKKQRYHIYEIRTKRHRTV